MESYSIPRKLSISNSRLPKKVVFSYVLDYVIIVILFIAFWALDAVEPFHQHFSLQNYTLQYPYAVHERVPVGLLFFLAVLCPAGIIAFYTLIIDGIFSHRHQQGVPQSGYKRWIGKYKLKHRLWELNIGILGLLLSSGTAFVITGALKNATGKPRPDLIARCIPIVGSVDPPVFGLSNSTICTQTDNSILKDGFRSFPSGHSSTAFGGLFYLSLYLTGKLHVLDNRGEVWKTYIVLMPTLGAALIAISRIMDARHHPFDVITGSLLGTLTAFCAYRQYFPPVSEAWRKGQAYPIRSWGTEPMGPSAMNAEREMARDQGIEPLRTVPFHVDEEQNTTPRAGGLPLSHDPYADPVSDQNDSVNQQASGQPYDRQSPHHSTSSSPHELQNPFSSTSVTRGRPIDGGENWYSLDDDNDEGGYELQPRSMLSDSHLGLDQADTAYKPQSYTAYTQGPPTHRDIGPETIKPPTGDLGIP